MDKSVRYLSLLILFVASPGQAEHSLRILLTNDDGFESPGIKAMRTALTSAGHNVYVIAPATQQSGASASITSGGVQVTVHPDQTWAVHGKPADAVRVGLGNILYENPPDLVVSGANFGQNTGQDVNLSGTVGAAITAFRLGIPAIAISVGIKLEEAKQGFPSTIGAFSGAGRLLTRLIENMDIEDLTSVLNVNYPAELPLDVRGVRWSRLSDHSIIGKRYNRQPDGSFAPEFESPYPNARKYDAESLVDGFVTLTFLDGNMSVATHRSQKYLDRQLLDRHYEAEYKPATQPRRSKPVAEPQTPVRVERQPMTEIPAAPEDEQVVNIEPAPVGARPESRTLPATNNRTNNRTINRTTDNQPPPTSAIEIPPPEAAAAKAVIREAEPIPESASEPESESEPEPELQKTKRRKKPDSWLRRMFDPKSWRR